MTPGSGREPKGARRGHPTRFRQDFFEPVLRCLRRLADGRDDTEETQAERRGAEGSARVLAHRCPFWLFC